MHPDLITWPPPEPLAWRPSNQVFQHPHINYGRPYMLPFIALVDRVAREPQRASETAAVAVSLALNGFVEVYRAVEAGLDPRELGDDG